MSQNDQPLDRLLRSAARVEYDCDEAPGYYLECRVLAELRRGRKAALASAGSALLNDEDLSVTGLSGGPGLHVVRKALGLSIVLAAMAAIVGLSDRSADRSVDVFEEFGVRTATMHLVATVAR